ncbi:hypothetical protein FISHEDRAFT_75680 [Fistulina hepatica ATCC 64428]|uniref:Uncharacterized protein n=1 Tax=Fistulina hepatica ATCC 64428 TaxID=1128425 RepID=A0A0D7A6T3_9AGAR|nr:hypothetical protein FISHEDRAFT_75680 [Fistulina hepatica ATCC 64428]
MSSTLEKLEKKIAKITSQIESMDKGGGKKRKREEVEEGGEGELAGGVDMTGALLTDNREKGKRRVPVEEAPPDDEYEESSEESGLGLGLGLGLGELGEEDKEDKGEVQGPLEDPELVGRMKELGESFEWVQEEMGDKLKGMVKDIKMVKMEVAKLFGALGDWEVGPGEAQSRIMMGDLLGQVEHPRFQMWAASVPNAVGWSVV